MRRADRSAGRGASGLIVSIFRGVIVFFGPPGSGAPIPFIRRRVSGMTRVPDRRPGGGGMIPFHGGGVMRSRLIFAAVLLACAFALRAGGQVLSSQSPPFGQRHREGPSGDERDDGHLPPISERQPREHAAIEPQGGRSDPGRERGKRSTSPRRAVPIGNLAMQGGSSQGRGHEHAGHRPRQGRNPCGTNRASVRASTATSFPDRRRLTATPPTTIRSARTYAYAPATAIQTSPGAPPTAPSAHERTEPASNVAGRFATDRRGRRSRSSPLSR